MQMVPQWVRWLLALVGVVLVWIGVSLSVGFPCGFLVSFLFRRLLHILLKSASINLTEHLLRRLKRLPDKNAHLKAGFRGATCNKPIHPSVMNVI